MRDNMLAPEGAEALAETLAKHPSLEELYLGDTSRIPILDLPLSCCLACALWHLLQNSFSHAAGQ